MTYAKFYKGREELKTSGLSDILTASDSGKVDKGGLDDTRFAFGCLDDTLSKS